MSLKKIINDKNSWDALVAELDARIQQSYKVMSKTKDKDDMLRQQGVVYALEQLKFLRDKVNYQDQAG